MCHYYVASSKWHKRQKSPTKSYNPPTIFQYFIIFVLFCQAFSSRVLTWEGINQDWLIFKYKCFFVLVLVATPRQSRKVEARGFSGRKKPTESLFWLKNADKINPIPSKMPMNPIRTKF